MKIVKNIYSSIIIVSFLIACVSFYFLPSYVPIHIGVDGEIDSYGSKYLNILFPIICFILVFSFIMYFRYKSNNNYLISKSFTVISTIICLLPLALQIIIFSFQLMSIYTKDGYLSFSISKVCGILIGSLFVLIGNYLPKVSKNPVIGIRTSWTMNNPIAWQKSQRIGGWTMVICGFLVLFMGFLLKGFAFIVMFNILIIAWITITLLATYIYCRKISN